MQGLSDVKPARLTHISSPPMTYSAWNRNYYTIVWHDVQYYIGYILYFLLQVEGGRWDRDGMGGVCFGFRMKCY